MTALIEVHDLEVVLEGRRLLCIEHLVVEEGEVLVVMGPTGAGKSTLLQVLGGVIDARGRVLWRGVARLFPTSIEQRRRVAMVFQAPLLLSRSVLDNVAYGLLVRGLGRREARARAMTQLRRFGVGHLAARRVGGLSGGEGQRVALARAVVLRPEVLLLDEPLASLDAGTRAELASELRVILREEGITCVYVTHDREEAQAMGQRVAVLDEGRLLQVAPSDWVFLRPGTRRVAELVGTGNVLAGTVVTAADGATVALGPHRLTSALESPAGPVTVCVRPEEVSLHPAGTGGANHLPGVVVALRPVGAMVEVTLDCGLALIAFVPRRAVTCLGLRPGARVDAMIERASVHIITAAD